MAGGVFVSVIVVKDECTGFRVLVGGRCFRLYNIAFAGGLG
jgi:hypothetical protein